MNFHTRVTLLLVTLAPSIYGGPPTALEPATASGPRGAAFMPLGVYWAGEYLHATQGAIDWPKVEAALDDLARHHVNAVWLTHRSAAESADFARRAAPRGIYVVASIAELAGEVEHIRTSDHAALIQRTRAAWGDAPEPIAWGLGDEPRMPYMDAMAAYAQAWRRHAPGEPVTTVVMHGDMEAAGKAGFHALCADIYPYFSHGNPNGYGMAPWAAWVQNARKLRAITPEPWMMGQSYQEPWGPFEIGDTGNIVYLPGGAPHWVMPTPAQMSWQALAAVAEGAKGVFFFLYRLPMAGNPTAAAVSLPATVQARTDSGAPRALVYPDGRATPQYEALGRAFGWIVRHAALLAPLQPATVSEAWEAGAADGGVVSLLTSPDNGARYLMVVAAAESSAPTPRRVTLGPHITGLRNLDADRPQPLALAAPFRSATVTLEPGAAALFACTVNRANLPDAYGDDFSTDRFAADAITVRSVRRFGNGVLSAAGSGETHDDAFVVYDLEKLLPPLPAGGVRMLRYESVAVPADFRGAFWSVSHDGQTFEKLSHNEPGRPMIFSQRYLKVGLSWKQSSAAYAYGCLKRFSVVQWRKAAGAD